MLRWLIRNRLAAFERRFDYDVSYARHILDADPRAFLAFARVSALSAYRRDVPRAVHYAVKLTGTVAEDCGPCTQLMVTMALRDGVDPKLVAAVLKRDEDAMTDDVRLAVRYARAVLARDADADALRREALRRWGERGLVSLAFALTAARMFPTLKYALGHGAACRRVVVGGEPVAMLQRAS